MSLLTGYLKNLWKPSIINNLNQAQPVRFKWTDWRMLKDYKRRQMMIKLNPERQRLVTIQKNTILPREIREIAHEDITNMPRDSSRIRIRERCCLTSRPRGIVHRWKVSRIMFRHLADYNKLSGVQRATW